MLYNLLDKLFIGSHQQACQQLLQQYQKEKNLTVHFLYFANIVLNSIHDQSRHNKQKNIYYHALQQADFLLPDGIALRLLRQAARWKKIIRPSHTNRSNLNGTDFTVRFLLFLKKKYQCHVVCYGSTDEIVRKAAAFLQQKKINISSTHNGYQELDRSTIPSSTDNTITVVLVGRGSPLQEIWTYHHQQLIRDKKILTLTVGGLFEFWSGSETRAPKRIRTIKAERLRRLILNPQKNLKKVVASLQIVKILFTHILLKSSAK